MTRSINSQAKLKNFTIYFWINIQCGNWNSNIFRTGFFHLCCSCHELYSIILSPGCLPHAALARTHTDTHTHPLELRSVYGCIEFDAKCKTIQSVTLVGSGVISGLIEHVTSGAFCNTRTHTHIRTHTCTGTFVHTRRARYANITG